MYIYELVLKRGEQEKHENETFSNLPLSRKEQHFLLYTLGSEINILVKVNIRF